MSLSVELLYDRQLAGFLREQSKTEQAKQKLSSFYNLITEVPPQHALSCSLEVCPQARGENHKGLGGEGRSHWDHLHCLAQPILPMGSLGAFYEFLYVALGFKKCWACGRFSTIICIIEENTWLSILCLI